MILQCDEILRSLPLNTTSEAAAITKESNVTLFSTGNRLWWLPEKAQGRRDNVIERIDTKENRAILGNLWRADVDILGVSVPEALYSKNYSESAVRRYFQLLADIRNTVHHETSEEEDVCVEVVDYLDLNIPAGYHGVAYLSFICGLFSQAIGTYALRSLYRNVAMRCPSDRSVHNTASLSDPLTRAEWKQLTDLTRSYQDKAQLFEIRSRIREAEADLSRVVAMLGG